jgi:serine/threonine protein phosphatase 1
MSGKRAIVGHSSHKSGEVLDVGHLVCIDTYCYGGGWLTAMDVDTDEIWQVDRLGRSRMPRSS